MRKSTVRCSSPDKTAEVNMDLRSRQSEPLPDIPTLTYPRHYVTPLGARVNDGYEVPVSDEYEVPDNERYTYETVLGEEDEEIYAEVDDTKV